MIQVIQVIQVREIQIFPVSQVKTSASVTRLSSYFIPWSICLHSPFHQLVIATPLTEPRLLSIERRAGAAFARQFLIRSSLQCCSDRGQGWYFDHCWWSAGCLPPILAETSPTRWGRTCNLQPYQETKYPTKGTFQKYPSKKTSSMTPFFRICH